jgi:parallel beta-helix repeat protein
VRNRRFLRPAFEELESRVALSTFYVATGGNDSAAGSSAAPWRTLQHAVDAIHAGDTILVESGTYVGCRIGNSGTASAGCTLKADTGAKVVLNAPGPANKHNSILEIENYSHNVDYWTVSGFEVANSPHEGIDLRNTDYITVQNCTVHNSTRTGIFLAFSNHPRIQYNTSYSNGEHGIYDSNSGDYPTILGNTLYSNSSCGIHMNGDISQGGDGIISYGLIEKNIIHDNGSAGGSGINCDGVQNSTIVNNLLYNSLASGISLYKTDGGGPSSNNIVVNNTVLVASTGRWALNIQNGSTGNVAYNNILYNYGSYRGSINVSSDSLSGFKSDYNVVMSRFTTDDGNTILSLSAWTAKTGQDSHSLIATPTQLFVNPSNHDYHLLATSPAIDKGTSTDAPTTDLDGNSRPYGKGYDIGCYEWHGTKTAAASGAAPAVNNDAAWIVGLITGNENGIGRTR